MDENKESAKQNQITMWMILGGFAGLIFSVILEYMIGSGGFTLFIISCLSIVSGFIRIMIENKHDKAAHITNINTFQEEYNEYADKLRIVKSDVQVTLINEEHNIHLPIPHYIWIDNRILNIFPMAQYYIQYCTSSLSKPNVSELQLKSIPIESILYFEEVGELRRYTIASGGGTSLKGALLGYAIADDIGAIIGSREPITTNVVSEDDRRVELIYKNQQNEIETLEFDHDAYNIFKKLIPLKEFKKLVNLYTVQSAKDNFNTNKNHHQI